MIKLPEPDVFVLQVVRQGDCTWQVHSEHASRLEALEAAGNLDPCKYRKAGIMPQIRAYRPFQTHVMQEVRVGNE